MNVEDVILAAARRIRTTPYWVGGAVRDALLGRPFQDGDLVCRGARRLAQALRRPLKAKMITLDEHFQMYRLILPSPHPTPQQERTGSGTLNMLDVAEQQGRTIEQDLARRDFTINAMARPVGGQDILDPLGGRRDLHQKLIRGVSEAAFREDPLRLLRAFRFMAQFNFTLDPRTLRWLRGKTLGRVAAERIRQELLILLAQPAASRALIAMDRTGLLIELFPGLEACRRTAVRFYGRGGVLTHILASVENFEWIVAQVRRPSGYLPAVLQPLRARLQAYLEDPVSGHPRAALLKLGVLLHDIGKPATAEMIKGRMRFFEHEHVGAELAYEDAARLRFSRDESLAVRLWVKNHMRPGNLAAAPRVTEKAIARFFRDLGEHGVGMLWVSLADHYAYLARSKWGKNTDPVERLVFQMLHAYYAQREKVLPERVIDGHRLMKHLKLKPGPVVGTLLAAIQDAQVEGNVKTPEEALRYAKRKLKAHISKARKLESSRRTASCVRL